MKQDYSKVIQLTHYHFQQEPEEESPQEHTILTSIKPPTGGCSQHVALHREIFSYNMNLNKDRFHLKRNFDFIPNGKIV